jgi:hypothetical protein
VYAVGKLFQLFNLHEPGSDLLRASLLMNMKKLTFEGVTGFVGLKVQDTLLATLTFKEWVRSVSFDWRSKKLTLGSAGTHDKQSQETRTKEMARDMKLAYILLLESLTSSSAATEATTTSASTATSAAAAALVSLVEGKRVLNRFLVEVDAGNTLERKSEVLLREGQFDCTTRTRAAEWPVMNKSGAGKEQTSMKGAVQKEEENFSTFFIC